METFKITYQNWTGAQKAIHMLHKTSRQLWQTKPITDKKMFYYRRKYKKLKGAILSAVYLLF